MRWRFVEETVEETGANVPHRPGCREIDPDAALDVHPAGLSVERDVALRECWSCRPAMELLLGV